MITQGTEVTFTIKYFKDGKAQALNLVPAAALAGGDVVVGSIRSYNDAKGYGFITSPDCSQDIYFKRDHLPAELQGLHGNDVTGAQVRAMIRVTPDGKPQAEEVQ